MSFQTPLLIWACLYCLRFYMFPIFKNTSKDLRFKEILKLNISYPGITSWHPFVGDLHICGSQDQIAERKKKVYQVPAQDENECETQWMIQKLQIIYIIRLVLS